MSQGVSDSLVNEQVAVVVNGWDFLDRNRDWLTGVLAVIISLLVMLFFHNRFDDLDELRDLTLLISVLGGSIGGIRVLEKRRSKKRSDR